MNRGEKIAAQRDAGHQADEYGIDPLPYRRNARAVDDEDIQVDEDLDEDQGRVEDAIGAEQQPYGYGERGKSVAERAVDEGGEEGDGDKSYRGGVK